MGLEGAQRGVVASKARPLRITTRCSSLEDFILTFGLFAVDSTLFIGTKALRKVGERQRCAILLCDGRTLLNGIGEIVGVDRGPGHPGMRIKMVELDEASKETHKQIVAYSRMLAEDKTPLLPQMPTAPEPPPPAPAKIKDRLEEIDAGWDDIPVPLPKALKPPTLAPQPILRAHGPAPAPAPAPAPMPAQPSGPIPVPITSARANISCDVTEVSVPNPAPVPTEPPAPAPAPAPEPELPPAPAASLPDASRVPTGFAGHPGATPVAAAAPVAVPAPTPDLRPRPSLLLPALAILLLGVLIGVGLGALIF